MSIILLRGLLTSYRVYCEEISVEQLPNSLVACVNRLIGVFFIGANLIVQPTKSQIL